MSIGSLDEVSRSSPLSKTESNLSFGLSSFSASALLSFGLYLSSSFFTSLSGLSSLPSLSVLYLSFGLVILAEADAGSVVFPSVRDFSSLGFSDSSFCLLSSSSFVDLGSVFGFSSQCFFLSSFFGFSF
jgi:hypothetical protein